MELLAPLAIFALMWLLLVRPQQRRVRQHQAVVASLEVGDEVVTAGGIHGRIAALDQTIVSLEVAPGVVLRVLRAAVSQKVEPREADAGGGEAAVPEESSPNEPVTRDEA